MKIIDYNKNLDKNKITSAAYGVCQSANFPVTYQDVYAHLFENANLLLKLLINEEDKLVGFGVFENYQLFLENKLITMLYLSGMVIIPKYQGKNISKKIIKNAYSQLQSDLISLRTQNIAMAKSLLTTFDDNLLVIPGEISKQVITCLKQTKPFTTINKNGVIEKCYPNQLYYDLKAIKDNFNIKLQSTDALGVIIEPSQGKQKVLSCFKSSKK